MLTVLVVLTIVYAISLLLDKKEERDRKRWNEKHSNNVKDSTHSKQ